MSDKPILILVSGPPASGKTTIARQIVTHFSIPLICRDSLKEVLFDILGFADLAWSNKLGSASWGLLYYLVEQFLDVGKPLMLETNFSAQQDLPRFQAFQTIYKARIGQLFCKADPQVLYERFHRRALTDKRHPGHQDHLIRYEEYGERFLQPTPEPLPLSGPTLQVDTTEFSDIDYPAIYCFIELALQKNDE